MRASIFKLVLIIGDGREEMDRSCRYRLRRSSSDGPEMESSYFFFPFAPGRGVGAANDEDDDAADPPCFQPEAPIAVTFCFGSGRCL